MQTTVAIIGAGLPGRWLALAAARAGHRVFLEDVMPANLHHAQEELCRRRVDGVAFVSTIEDAVREADIAIDCVPDELESKLEIFCLLDRMAPPRTVLATPITRLSIADLAACTYRAENCMAIVAEAASLAVNEGRELLLYKTSKTSPGTESLVRGFCESIGFTVRVECDPAE